MYKIHIPVRDCIGVMLVVLILNGNWTIMLISYLR